MATYSRTFSNDSSTNTQSSNLPAVRQPMQSMELGQIIVHSLEVVSEALENKDVPVTAEQITKSVTEGVNKSNSVTKSDLEKSITDAINNSDLARKGLSTVSNSTRQVQTQPTDSQKKEVEKAKQQNPNNKNSASLAMQQYWEQKKFADEKKRKDKQDKLENESRQRKEKEYTQQIEQVFSKLNQFSKNPLAGVVNAFEGGIKKFFNKTMNTSLGDVGKHMKKGVDIAFAPIKATGQVLGGATKAVGKTALATTGLVAKGVGGITKGIGNMILGGIAVGSLVKDRMLSNDNLAGADLGGLIEGATKPNADESTPEKDNQNTNKASSGRIIECESIICKNIQNGMGGNNENINPEENENTTENESKNIVEEVVDKFGPELANLIQPDAKDSKKDRKEQKQEQAAQGKVLKSMGKGVDMLKNMTLIKFGAIVGIIGGIAAFLPQIIGILTPFINNIPMYWEDLKIKMGMIFSGPNSIGTQIKLALMETIQKIGLSLQNSDNALLKSLGAGMVSGVASGQQADLAEEFKQSQQYKTMLARGVSEEDMEKLLMAKDTEKLLGEYQNTQKKRLDKQTSIKVKDSKGRVKTRTDSISNMLMFQKDAIFGYEYDSEGNENEGPKIADKFNNFLEARTTEELMANTLTDEEMGKFTDYLMAAKMNTSDIQDIQQMYYDKLNLAEWLKVVETRESGKLITDFDAQKEENKAKSVDLENQKKAAWRIQRAESEGFSILDFQTDKEWDVNPYLKDLKDEMMSKYATELSKGEKVGVAAMQTTAAGQRLIGNLGANITGNSNSWQNAEQKFETKLIVSTTGNESGDLTRK